MKRNPETIPLLYAVGVVLLGGFLVSLRPLVDPSQFGLEDNSFQVTAEGLPGKSLRSELFFIREANAAGLAAAEIGSEQKLDVTARKLTPRTP